MALVIDTTDWHALLVASYYIYSQVDQVNTVKAGVITIDILLAVHYYTVAMQSVQVLKGVYGVGGKQLKKILAHSGGNYGLNNLITLLESFIGNLLA